MSKQRVTLTLEEENVEWMDSVCNNRSAYVNDIITEARRGDYNTTDILTAFERKKLDVEQKQLEAKLEAVQEAKKEFQTKEEQQAQETWKRALQRIERPTLRSIDTDDWRPDTESDVVRHFADELGMTPEEFCEQYPEKYEEINA
jgi:hypothetical protein